MTGSQAGFTLVELLIVVSILGLISMVVVPNVGKFIGTGKTESYESELHNVQTSVIALLADSQAKCLDQDYNTPTADMSTVQADNGTLLLSFYLTGLDGTEFRSGCTYTFSQDGKVVTQITP